MRAALPHDRVHARLGVSPIHGIGAFAIRAIPAGIDVFENDRRAIVWIDAADVTALPAESPERRFYIDFGIRHGGLIGCPAHFDLLSVGWYVNEPAAGDEANLIVAGDYQMLAARDIAAGEELTVRYDTFSRGDA